MATRTDKVLLMPAQVLGSDAWLEGEGGREGGRESKGGMEGEGGREGGRDGGRGREGGRERE